MVEQGRAKVSGWWWLLALWIERIANWPVSTYLSFGWAQWSSHTVSPDRCHIEWSPVSRLDPATSSPDSDLGKRGDKIEVVNWRFANQRDSPPNVFMIEMKFEFRAVKSQRSANQNVYLRMCRKAPGTEWWAIFAVVLASGVRSLAASHGSSSPGESIPWTLCSHSGGSPRCSAAESTHSIRPARTARCLLSRCRLRSFPKELRRYASSLCNHHCSSLCVCWKWSWKEFGISSVFQRSSQTHKAISPKNDSLKRFRVEEPPTFLLG